MSGSAPSNDARVRSVHEIVRPQPSVWGGCRSIFVKSSQAPAVGQSGEDLTNINRHHDEEAIPLPDREFLDCQFGNELRHTFVIGWGRPRP